jgi:hypothetical protein
MQNKIPHFPKTYPARALGAEKSEPKWEEKGLFLWLILRRQREKRKG